MERCVRKVHGIVSGMVYVILLNHIGRHVIQKYMVGMVGSSLWYSGMVIYVISNRVSFLGYTIVFGNMSFWGSTVIVSTLTFIPNILPYSGVRPVYDVILGTVGK